MEFQTARIEAEAEDALYHALPICEQTFQVVGCTTHAIPHVSSLTWTAEYHNRRE